MTATLFVNGHKNTLPMISTDLELLYHDIVPTLAKRVGGDFADVAEVNLWQEALHLSHLSADDFDLACDLIIKSCNKHQTLQKYKTKLQALFKSDPRYTA
ncbi:MAG: hypothetical protein Q4A69_02695 [Moraxella sp.]|nr:hypothetical protein [Moraxella sp.]